MYEDGWSDGRCENKCALSFPAEKPKGTHSCGLRPRGTEQREWIMDRKSSGEAEASVLLQVWAGTVRSSKTRCGVRRDDAHRRWLIDEGVAHLLRLTDSEPWTLVGRDRCTRSIFLFFPPLTWRLKILQLRQTHKQENPHSIYIFNNPIISLQMNLRRHLAVTCRTLWVDLTHLQWKEKAEYVVDTEALQQLGGDRFVNRRGKRGGKSRKKKRTKGTAFIRAYKWSCVKTCCAWSLFSFWKVRFSPWGFVTITIFIFLKNLLEDVQLKDYLFKLPARFSKLEYHLNIYFSNLFKE